MKEIVRAIFGNEASEDEDIVRLYKEANGLVIEALLRKQRQYCAICDESLSVQQSNAIKNAPIPTIEELTEEDFED